MRRLPPIVACSKGDLLAIRREAHSVDKNILGRCVDLETYHAIQLGADGKTIHMDKPVSLFPARIGGAVSGVNRQQYVASPDGQKFLMNTITEEGTAPITVVLNLKPKA